MASAESASGLTLSQVLSSPFLLALFSGSAFALVLILVAFCVLAASLVNNDSRQNNDNDQTQEDKRKAKRKQ